MRSWRVTVQFGDEGKRKVGYSSSSRNPSLQHAVWDAKYKAEYDFGLNYHEGYEYEIVEKKMVQIINVEERRNKEGIKHLHKTGKPQKQIHNKRKNVSVKNRRGFKVLD